MLRITQQSNSKEAKRYYASADYYSEGQEVIGSWGGMAAKMLGLQGVVDKQSFDLLCDNLDPSTGKPLTVRTRTNRTVGYDFTFSVPKSLSLLYAMTGDPELLEAFRTAINDTMRDIEAEMKTRVRKAGKDAERTTGNMVWAEFIHTTSRPVDGVPCCQLHAHLFVANATWDQEEHQWKAIQCRDIKRDAPYFQAAFRVRLANRLQELCFGIERKRDDFEIAGIPATAISKFARRTDEIERIASERGITDPKRKAELGAETREQKKPALTWEELRQEWNSRLTDDERDALAKTHRRDVAYELPAGKEREAVDYALAHVFVREAVVPERKLLTEALKRGIGSVTVEGTKRELAGRPLVRGDKNGQELVTTEAVLAEDERIVAFGREGRGRYRPLGDARRPTSRQWLNDSQKAAVRHVLGSRDRVTLIRGAAGTGKTTLMQEAVEKLEESGKRVTVLAPSVKASVDVLRGEGFAEADTVARFLVDSNMQMKARGQIIWVDEAGLLGTKDMARLFDLAGTLNARIVLSGDRRQHRGVARGEPLKLLEEKAGLPVAEVTEIIRQSGDYRQAVTMLSKGQTAEAFAVLDKLGWIRQVSDAERYQHLAAAYLTATKEKEANGKPSTALVVCPTHAESARIASTIRESLKVDGKLGEERSFTVWVPANLTNAQKSDATNFDAGDMVEFTQNVPGHEKGSRVIVKEGTKLPRQFADRFAVYRPVKMTLAVGDRIRITAGGKTKDGRHRLNNGTLLTLTGFTRQGDLVVDHGWVIAKQWGHLDQGYVVTSHASQGSTVDKVFIGQSSESFPASNRRQFYVSVSRAKRQAVVFTDQKTELLRSIDRPDEPTSAIELMESKRKKPPRRQRLHKHLAFMRRLDTFGQTHEPGPPDPHRTPPFSEPVHAR
jgi:conjugative relaxase-like TrwC/TraI family protein